MADNKADLFKDFMELVDPQHRDFVSEIDNYLTKNSYVVQVKPTSSGYLVSYITKKPKKTMINFVFRKSGIIIRIYASNVNKYLEFLDTLPEEMIDTMNKASVCKRLVNPDDCNPKCAMGYDFIVRGERYQKCRNSAFMFLLTEESNPYIMAFLEHEINLQN